MAESVASDEEKRKQEKEKISMKEKWDVGKEIETDERSKNNKKHE